MEVLFIPRLRNSPDPKKLSMLITYYRQVVRNMTVEEVSARSGVCKQTYEKRFGMNVRGSDPAGTRLSELHRVGRVLHIPKEEILEAVWAAIKYDDCS
jgi:hypothetical protein